MSLLMIGKSWFPGWNEYGKDLYPAADSRSSLICCPCGEARTIPAAVPCFSQPDDTGYRDVASDFMMKSGINEGN